MSDEAASPSAANRWKMRALWIAVIGGLVAVFAMLQIPPPRHFTCGYSCLANLKQIDGAVQQWALENGKMPTDTYSFSDPTILAYLRGGHSHREIFEDYPTLPVDGIDAVIRWAEASFGADWRRSSEPAHWEIEFSSTNV